MRADFEQQTSFYHPKLIELLGWLEDVTGVEFTQTSSHRIDDPGVHGTLPLRATDLRCPLGSLGVQLELLVNKNWSYDPERPQMACAIYHDVGRGRHLHLQVHPNTERRL